MSSEFSRDTDSSQIPNMGFLFAERFADVLLRAAKCLRFPVTLVDHSFAFTLFPLLLSGYIAYCVF